MEIELLDIRGMIEKGVKLKEVIHLDAYDKDIVIRPLADYEIDLANRQMYKIPKDKATLKYLVELKVGVASLDDQLNPDEIDVDDLMEALTSVSYYVVFYAMKDFCTPDFTIEDVKKLHGVKMIAKKVWEISGRGELGQKALDKFPGESEEQKNNGKSSLPNKSGEPQTS